MTRTYDINIRMVAVIDIDLSDPAVLADPLVAYGRAREHGPLTRLLSSLARPSS